jgi:hypothetical protein
MRPSKIILDGRCSPDIIAKGSTACRPPKIPCALLDAPDDGFASGVVTTSNLDDPYVGFRDGISGQSVTDIHLTFF